MAISFDNITNFFLGASLGKLSGNFSKVSSEFSKVLYRDGSNVMAGPLDMNSKRIINVPNPIDGNDVVNLRSVQSIAEDISKGPPGPANSTYTSLADMQAAEVSNRSYNLASPVGSDGGVTNGTFFYRTDQAPYVESNDVVRLTSVPLVIGALVRQGAQAISYTAPGATVSVDLKKSADLRATTPQELRGVPNDASASAHAAFLALSGTSRDMIVPPGDYLIDNTTVRQIDYYTGELRFSPGSRLIAVDQTKPLLYFYGGSPKVRGVTLTTRDVPTVRQLNAPMLLMTDCDNPVISDVVVERGAGAGIVIIRGDGLRASNIIVENTLADGFDLFNANNFDISSVYVDGVGDDPFAVIDFQDGPQITRGLARGINVKNSNTRGITMPGPTGVILDGFTIEETQGSGLLIAQDASNGTRIPRGCKAANGNIKRAGQRVVEPDYSGQKYGIEVGESGAIDLDNITVVDGKTRGLAAFSGQLDGRLSTNSIIIQNCGAEGIHVDGMRTWLFDNIYVEDSGSIGIYAHNINRMVGGLRSVVRAAKTGGGSRAVHDDANINFISVQHTHIADDQQNPTGFIYRNDGQGIGCAGSFTWAVNGVFYYSQAAPYITVKGHGGPRLDGLILPAANATISTRDAFDRYTTGALTQDMNVVLADFGQYAGMKLSFTRYDVSGTSVVNLRDANNGGQIVTSVPAGGSPSKAVVWWDAAASPPQWRAFGKYSV